MPFVTQTVDRRDLPAGTCGPTVYVVVSEWVVDDHDVGDGMVIEAAYLSRKGAEADLETGDPSGLRQRRIIAVECQP